MTSLHTRATCERDQRAGALLAPVPIRVDHAHTAAIRHQRRPSRGMACARAMIFLNLSPLFFKAFVKKEPTSDHFPQNT
jgi:hypothetical protein